MTELLTLREYQAIANSMDIPKTAFINGKNRPGQGKKLKTKNPATGELIATIASCNAKDVDLAVKKANEAFNKGVWAKKTPQDRKEIFRIPADGCVYEVDTTKMHTVANCGPDRTHLVMVKT